jgi:hypothetical protein
MAGRRLVLGKAVGVDYQKRHPHQSTRRPIPPVMPKALTFDRSSPCVRKSPVPAQVT